MPTAFAASFISFVVYFIIMAFILFCIMKAMREAAAWEMAAAFVISNLSKFSFCI